MTHTVTILADHKGIARPSVMGDEYVVDGFIDTTSYTAGGEVISASSFGLTTITAVVITGLSTDTISGGYAVSMIVAEIQSGAANGGKYASNSTFQLVAPAASNTDNIGEVRVRIWGLI